MATVNFSVPDRIKKAFNAAFRGENKSVVLAQLMWQAVENRTRQKQRALVVAAILKLRSGAKPVTEDFIRRARHKGRPRSL